MAWTVTESCKEFNNGNLVLTLSMTSDANASSYDIVTYLDRIKGKFLYLMKTVPAGGDDAPSGAFDLDLEDEDASHILDTDANAADAAAWHEGSATLGRDPMIEDFLKVVCATLGNGNIATVKLYFSDVASVTQSPTFNF